MVTKISKFSTLALGLAALVWAQGCQKHCQAPAQTSVRNLSEVQWRLVESTDPDVAANLDRFTFLLLQFSRNLTGVINKVVNNDQYDTPIQTFIWNVDYGAKRLRIQYKEAVTGEGENQTGGGDLGTFDYTYSLGRQLELHESRKGYYYRYVPFQGIVDPDSNCTF